MRRSVGVLLAILCFVSCSRFNVRPATPRPAAGLDIYFLDMVGGGATLIVTPSGESVLIDTGSREPKHRDAERIYRATQLAGLNQIDYLVTTHFHSDHFGGLPQLATMIPIKTFMDKGAPAPPQDGDAVKDLYRMYQEVTKGQVQTIKVGKDVPLKNDPEGKIPPITLHCVAAEKRIEGFDGVIDAPVPGFEIRKPDNGDNARSIALVLTYGRFKFFAGGDITWNVEHHLAHPLNRIGKVDLFQVTHHGLDLSNNPLLLAAMRPTVCVAMNGPRKGIQPNAFRALGEIADVRAIFQIHYNTQYGPEGNTRPEYIANAKDPSGGELIKVSVNPQKQRFTVSFGVSEPKWTYRIQ